MLEYKLSSCLSQFSFFLFFFLSLFPYSLTGLVWALVECMTCVCLSVCFCLSVCLSVCLFRAQELSDNTAAFMPYSEEKKKHETKRKIISIRYYFIFLFYLFCCFFLYLPLSSYTQVMFLLLYLLFPHSEVM